MRLEFKELFEKVEEEEGKEEIFNCLGMAQRGDFSRSHSDLNKLFTNMYIKFNKMEALTVTMEKDEMTCGVNELLHFMGQLYVRVIAVYNDHWYKFKYPDKLFGVREYRHRIHFVDVTYPHTKFKYMFLLQVTDPVNILYFDKSDDLIEELDTDMFKKDVLEKISKYISMEKFKLILGNKITVTGRRTIRFKS